MTLTLSLLSVSVIVLGRGVVGCLHYLVALLLSIFGRDWRVLSSRGRVVEGLGDSGGWGLGASGSSLVTGTPTEILYEKF